MDARVKVVTSHRFLLIHTRAGTLLALVEKGQMAFWPIFLKRVCSRAPQIFTCLQRMTTMECHRYIFQ